MEDVMRLRRIGGAGLVAGAVGFIAAGMLHPGSTADSLREATIAMVAEPTWPVAHWIALVTMLLLAATIWIIVDAGVTRGSAAAQAGARLTILAGLFMAVQSAAEVAAPSARDALVAGQDAPLVAMIESMQAVGWPVISLGWILLVLGCGRALAPRPIAALAIVGAAAMALGGILVEGFGIVGAGALFQLGGLQALWLLWAGLRLVRVDRSSARVYAAEPVTAGRSAV